MSFALFYLLFSNKATTESEAIKKLEEILNKEREEKMQLQNKLNQQTLEKMFQTQASKMAKPLKQVGQALKYLMEKVESKPVDVSGFRSDSMKILAASIDKASDVLKTTVDRLFERKPLAAIIEMLRLSAQQRPQVTEKTIETTQKTLAELEKAGLVVEQ